MSWVCINCGTNNEDDAETCFICDAKKGEGLSSGVNAPAAPASMPTHTPPASASSGSSSNTPAPSSSSHAPSYPFYSYSSGIEMSELFSLGTIATIFFICLGLAVAATLLGGFLSGWVWSVMKWVLGAGWGLTIVSGLMALSSYLEEECSTDTWSVPCAIFLGVFILLNVLLYALIGGGYKCIFIWFSAYSIIGSVLSALADFDDVETGCGVFACFEGVFALAALILGLIFI